MLIISSVGETVREKHLEKSFAALYINFIHIPESAQNPINRRLYALRSGW